MRCVFSLGKIWERVHPKGCLLSATKMHSELCRIAEVKPLINNVELFGIPLGINMLRHVIPMQSRRLVRESLGAGMGHWGGLRYIYMHSASGGYFSIC